MSAGKKINRLWIALGYVPFAISLIAIVLLYGPVLLKKPVEAESAARRTHTLTAPLRIGGATLPAGTVVTDPDGQGLYVVHTGANTLTIGQAPFTD